MTLGQLVALLRRPGFWFIAVVLTLITVPHYVNTLSHPAFLTYLMTQLSLDRASFERVLYLAPIVWAGFIFSWRGALVTSIIALISMLPVALFSPGPASDALFGVGAVFILGNVLALGFHSLRKEREYRGQLEKAKDELQAYIKVVEQDKKRLLALNKISTTVSQYLDLDQILNSAVVNVIDVMNLDAAWIFLLDKSSKELVLSAHRGIPEEFVGGVSRLKIGEGLNGEVAASGKPMYIADSAEDKRLTRMVVRHYGIRAQLIVPLSTKKGGVNGTLCAAMRSLRTFTKEEVDLLVAIGNQISVAVENASLYEQQRKAAEELRASEHKYRQLFESALDPIWVHDLDGNIIAANSAAEKIIGYRVEDLVKMNVRDFLSPESLVTARRVRDKLLADERVEQPYEQHLTRHDGSEILIQLSTSKIMNNGRVVAFQHIARDITQEKRMQENMRFYVEQITRAQEDERKRISRELHDDTIQALIVLSRQLDAMASSPNLMQEVRHGLEELWEQTNNIVQGMRRLSQDLRPAALDRLGLLPALQWLASDVSGYSGLQAWVTVRGKERSFPEETKLVLFRIIQEALRNVWRHAQATSAEVVVEFLDDRTLLTVTDNGKGFDLPKTIGDLARYGKLGMAGMEERAQLIGATLAIQSEPGRGTRVTVDLPA